jgi:hypothetical protein
MRFLRDPVVHFVILGAALFGVYALVTGVFSSGDVRRIEIGEAEIEFLAGNFQRQWGRAPTPEELQGLVRARVREEILYREALAVGLDRNDVVVRRRMVQKMELLTQDLATLADPTDAELRAFFTERPEDYRIPPRLSFSHVYFNEDRRGASVEEDAREVLAGLLEETPPPDRAPERGDSIMIDDVFARASPDEVRRIFGDRFAEALFQLGPGWQGPIHSGYGLHLVNVGERVEGRIPEYDEIRERLVEDFNRLRRDRANEALYESLAGQYEIIIGGETVTVVPEAGAAEDSPGS